MVAGGAMAAAVLALCAQPPAADPLLDAMHDEVDRSVKLSLPNLEAPYFVQYVLDESDSFSVAASLGALLSRSRDRFRLPEVHVRVGDYKFDNTNFAGGGGGGGSRYDLESFPLDNDYPVLRRYLWLETDSAYKGAVEAISRKRAAMRNINQSDQLNDFAHAVPVQVIKPFQKLSHRRKDLGRPHADALRAVCPISGGENLRSRTARRQRRILRGEFRRHRGPGAGECRLRARTSHGASGRRNDAARGGDLPRPGCGPSAVGRRNDSQSDQDGGEPCRLWRRAPKGEDYNGPVLFEGEAGPQIFAEVLAKNLTLSRMPAGARGGPAQSSEFEGRMGARILPDSFEVVDDPTQKEWRGKALFGSYDVDREGVVPKPLHLVEKGTLKGFLLTRQPVRGFEGSNGRARLPGGQFSVADVSNLFISSNDSIPAADMKKKLIELIQTRGKPYGIVVRQMDFPSTAAPDELRRLVQGEQGATHPVSMPLLVYKVFPDGHEELVRGMHFRGLNARSLKDILAVGDDATVFDFMDSIAPFALVGYANYTTEACVVAPSIIVDDLELHPVEDEMPKLPVVPAPELVK